MKITPKLKIGLRMQNLVFVVLLLAIAGALAYLTRTYVWQADWTAGGRNSLTDASVKLLKTLDGPVTITAFARDNGQLRDAIRRFIGKYQRADSKITLKFVNPDTEPARVRDLGITSNGELYVQYQGRSDKVSQLTEPALTNALLKIARASASKVVFLTGHGERSPKGHANFDYGQFAKALKAKGFKVATLNLTTSPKIPADTALLVIASPQANYLPGEVKLIQDYVAGGGNLLWMHDPGPLHGLAPLAKALDVHFMKGTIVDATSRLFGVQDVRWLVLAKYPPSEITRHLDIETLIPGATAVQPGPDEKWRATPFLKSRSLPRSWLESGKLEGEIKFDKDAGDQGGPLDIGITLARPLAALKKVAKAGTAKDKKDPSAKADPPAKADPSQGDQRVVVIGDGDFLANAYLGNGGNLDLGLNIFNWLSGNDNFIDINVPPAPDKHLVLSQVGQSLLGGGFLIALPLLLLLYGGLIWFRRRRA
ncbi:MAG TPA: GldG family protein [Gammaproteobacteria bacterium]|nr:GldG family protein [Gammaproteobacteria bacterium]